MDRPTQDRQRRRAAVTRIVSLYASRQFASYVACGTLAAVTQLGVRYAFNAVLSFPSSVILSYLAGMIVALLLYRRYVFDACDGSLRRQALLFALSYVVLFPISLGLSLGAAGGLTHLLAQPAARLLGHAVGVAAPVALNFAFNKFVTFRPRFVAQESAS